MERAGARPVFMPVALAVRSLRWRMDRSSRLISTPQPVGVERPFLALLSPQVDRSGGGVAAALQFVLSGKSILRGER